MLVQVIRGRDKVLQGTMFVPYVQAKGAATFVAKKEKWVMLLMIHGLLFI